MRLVNRVGLLAAGILGILLFLSPPAAGAIGEDIDHYGVVLDIRPTGDIRTTETITYDFGTARRHGIDRRIPIEFKYSDTKNRVYPIKDVNVLMDGNSVQYKTDTDNGYFSIRIGDPDKIVTGLHAYEISYTISGAFNNFADHQELYWNVIGDEWEVPINSVSVLVNSPVEIKDLACFAGPAGSHAGCGSVSELGKRSATFTNGQLNSETMTVVIALPSNSVSQTGPILEERRDFVAAFRITPWTITGASVLAALGIAVALIIAWIVGRDRSYASQIPGLTPMSAQSDSQARKRLFNRGPIAVEFTPPDKVKPAQAGTLLDERADTIDITATIIDFAVAKHLHIREIPREGRFAKQDWELTKLTEGDPKFSAYEKRLFAALFKRGSIVKLSQLKNYFHRDLAQVKKELYQDVVSRHWYRHSPESIRNRYRFFGIIAVILAVIITGALAVFTHIAFIGVGLIIAAIVFLVAATYMPARTARGSAMLARLLGFRQYLITAEADQIQFEEREDIFSRYLPYAIVFGVAERWADVFGDLGAGQSDGSTGLYWYTGAAGWNLGYFGASIGSFTSSANSVIASTPSATAGTSGASGFGGGGFSGGGGGGGGGGSW